MPQKRGTQYNKIGGVPDAEDEAEQQQDIYEEGVLNYDEQRKGLLESIHKFV